MREWGVEQIGVISHETKESMVRGDAAETMVHAIVKVPGVDKVPPNVIAGIDRIPFEVDGERNKRSDEDDDVGKGNFQDIPKFLEPCRCRTPNWRKILLCRHICYLKPKILIFEPCLKPIFAKSKMAPLLRDAIKLLLFECLVAHVSIDDYRELIGWMQG